MAHRKSPARIAKDARVAHLNALAASQPADDPTPWQALATLEYGLLGYIVLPGNEHYEKDRQESNPAFQAYPWVIVYCKCENDVALCLAYARTFNAWVAVRCGGHSTAGYSVNSGMVVDLSLMSGVVLDPSQKVVTVLPGTDFEDFNAAMNHTGWHVPTGACGNVCVGGFVQGGGYGYTSRAFGIQSDLVQSMRVMLADGSIVVASETENDLLYWALRGGTGGNFGVVLQVTYRMVPLDQVWAWSISWDAAHAAEVLALMQTSYMKTGAPDALGYMMNLGYYQEVPVYMVQGMFCGTREAGMQAIASLMDVPSARLLVDQVGTYTDMNKYLEDQPYTLPDNLPAKVCESKASAYIPQPMTQAQWQQVVDYFGTSPNKWSLAYLEPYGGAINRYPVADSAFIHRDVACDLVVDVFWQNEEERAHMELWLAGFMELVKPWLSGAVYQNYPDATLENFADAYWDAPTYAKLQQAKLRYDPTNFFHYAQSIALPKILGD
ncbi:FAD-binding oxidoreductase [Acidovorax sp. SUPP3334]|uniref:FAD-binding oxidoreductase n=1 Tax=Acidovorax sp. SUPP3334 TaxID=2920881 RepID=UPI0023DE3D2A|nr:FAD-binding oxidoreductase [Acidovorax sp. SUPP3334]GKT20430.1 FAD-binding protein [Acidovorax sp. SUPP3334]